MSSKFILYDLPSKEPNKTWSLNPWKTRLLLNYKQLPYETQWIEYPDIKPTLEAHVPPNTEKFAYSIPAVQFPDGSYVQDSRKIVNRIEKEYPDPPVDLDSEILLKLEVLVPKIHTAIGPDYVPKVSSRLLNPPSQAHFYKDRSARMGMPLEQLEKEKGGDAAYLAAKEQLEEVSGLLAANKDGPFFEGNKVTYADFVWAGYLRFLQRIGDDVYNKAVETSGNAAIHQAHMDACQPWLARDDY